MRELKNALERAMILEEGTMLKPDDLFRPAYIYPVEPRKEPNFSYGLLRGIYPAFRVLFPNQVIQADDLARAMVDVAVWGTGKHGGPVFENRDIRAMVESLDTHE